MCYEQRAIVSSVFVSRAWRRGRAACELRLTDAAAPSKVWHIPSCATLPLAGACATASRGTVCFIPAGARQCNFNPTCRNNFHLHIPVPPAILNLKRAQLLRLRHQRAEGRRVTLHQEGVRVDRQHGADLEVHGCKRTRRTLKTALRYIRCRQACNGEQRS